MDSFGDMFGGLGDIVGEMFGGGEGGAEGMMGLAEMFSPEGRRRGETQAIVHERYLCGGPRQLNINDR